jgi:hypothetical protein
VEARALSATGRTADAVELAGRLIEFAEISQSPVEQFDARIDAAEVFKESGRTDVARRLLERLQTDSLARGAVGYAREAQRVLDQLDESG